MRWYGSMMRWFLKKYDANSPEFYSEITRRMARAFPELRVKGLDGRTQGVKKPAPNSGMQVANPRSGARRTAPGTSPRERVELDRDSRLMARELGIDLKDKQWRNAYESEKIKSAKASASARRNSR